MNAHSADNEGLRILEEFVCQAISELSVIEHGPNPSSGSSANEGMATRKETDLDVTLGRIAVPPGENRIAVQCPHCGQRYWVNAIMAGSKARCSPCGAVFEISAP